MLTGVEIHPAAKIGDALFIDHGAGVVIGETAEIGDNVTLYQGVTLGGTGFARGKRHPTVGDNVVVGSGAKLLGPIDVGHCAKIGANSVVIHDVPENSTVVGNPGHPVRVDGRKPEGPDADWAHLPDPVADAIKGLAARVNELEGVIAELTGKRPETRRGDPAAPHARQRPRRRLTLVVDRPRPVARDAPCSAGPGRGSRARCRASAAARRARAAISSQACTAQARISRSASPGCSSSPASIRRARSSS